MRDTSSAKILDRQGIYADVGYDPVFSLPPRMPPMPVVQPKKIGISLRGGFFSQEQIQMMQKGIQWLIKQGKEVVFLSHSLCGDIYHNDRLFVEEHFGTAYPLTTSLEETLEMYASLDAVIAMRLHSAILAARYGIPVLALPYGPKGMSLTSLLDIDEYTIDTESFSFERFQSIFSSLCDNYQNAQQKIIASYQQIHEKFLKKIEESGILDG